MAEIKNSILAGTFLGIIMGILISLIHDLNYGIMSGILSGLFFGISIYLFVKSKTVKNQTEIKNVEGLEILHYGRANHFLNSEAVGGKLYLLSNKIEFKSHNFNVQNDSLIILLNDIKEVKFYKTLGIVPNGLSIITNNNIEEKFVVNNRDIWKEKIENQLLKK